MIKINNNLNNKKKNQLMTTKEDKLKIKTINKTLSTNPMINLLTMERRKVVTETNLLTMEKRKEVMETTLTLSQTLTQILTLTQNPNLMIRNSKESKSLNKFLIMLTKNFWLLRETTELSLNYWLEKKYTEKTIWYSMINLQFHKLWLTPNPHQLIP